jgi:hypothetical protein
VLHQYTTGADGYAPGYLRRIRDADGFASGPIYTDILERDAWGNVTREQRGRSGTGAAIEISRGYDADTGRLTGLGANRVGGGPLQSWTYRWGRVGNLHDRIDGLGASGSLREVFVYDPLNRLLRTHTGTLAAPATLTLSYLPNGNIGTRMVDNNWATSVGYAYGLPMSQPSPVCTSNVPGSVSPGPHAATSVVGQAGTTLYRYDASGRPGISRGIAARRGAAGHGWPDRNAEHG